VKRLGVIGTMVWDRIYRRMPLSPPVEEWGGIAYALAGLEAALDDTWEIVPLVRVGRDLAPPAHAFLRELSRCAATARFIEVPHANNRVTLHYDADLRRTERLSGGVPAWTWTELGSLVRDLDALYINFISGFEMGLETARQLRHGFPGPIYADLHSLLLGVSQHGHRFPQGLPDVDAWFGCFDAVQVNEQELTLIGPDPMLVAARALGAGVGLLVVTLGNRGAVYFAQPGFAFRPGQPARADAPVETARVPPTDPVADGDPTGCGDVFGATLVAALLAAHPVPSAIRLANAAAGRNLRHRGASRLHHHLRGAIAPR
jgi:sugar/nucleoside kinase (ribokinase family)